MKAIILEDENVASRRLKKMLTACQVQVLAEATSLKAFSDLSSLEAEVDLYFLDIQLTDGNIFDYLSQESLSKPVIFTTAYDQYALEAFRLFSIDYLLKPFSMDELKRALDKFEQYFSNNKNQKLEKLLTHLNKQAFKERLLVKIGDKFKSIPVEEISLFYSEKKMTMAFAKDGRSYPIDGTIEQLNQTLDPTIFFQINRGMIIRIDSIAEIFIVSSSRLKIILPKWKGESIIVARERVNDFKSWLGR